MSIESILVPKPEVPRHYLESLDGQIQQVLSNKSIPSDVKFSLYNQILSKWNTAKEDMKKPTKLTVVSQAPVQTTKQAQKQKTPAGRLREFLDIVPTVEIMPDKSVVVNNKPIRGTNIDVILEDLTHNKKTRNPKGSKQIAKELREHSVPLTLITNPNRFSWFVNEFTEFPPHDQSWTNY